MESKIYKILIVLLGTALTYLKYNIANFVNIEYIMLIIISLIVILMTSIYLLNKKVYGLKFIIINPKIISILKRINLFKN